MADDIWALVGRLIEDNARLKAHIARVEGAMNNMFRPGKVTDVDTKKQRARIEVANQDGKITKSAWIPYGQIAGDYKQHRPPTKGQQLMMMSPDGEFRQAMLMPLTWSDDIKSPSEKEDEHVSTYNDKYRLVEKADLRAFTLDKTKQVFTKDKITTSINGGNTPKDGNGSKADDGDGQNDQADAGSSIVQEEKKLVHKVDQTKVTHDDKSFTFEAAEKITLKVGASTIVIEAAKITATSSRIETDGKTYLGDPMATEHVMLESGPATKVWGL